MRLDELLPDEDRHAKHDIATGTLSAYRVAGIYTFYWYPGGAVPMREWADMDPLTAQAVLFELTKNL